MFGKIIPSVFLISFGLGMLICYLYTPQPKVIFKYPTLDNLDQVYHNDNNTCYKYTIKNVKCN